MFDFSLWNFNDKAIKLKKTRNYQYKDLAHQIFCKRSSSGNDLINQQR